MARVFNFDNSMLDTYTCPAAFLCKYRFNLSGKTILPWGDLGSAVHTALETHFVGGSVNETLAVLEAEYDKIIPEGTVPEVDAMLKSNVLDNIKGFCQNNPIHTLPYKVIDLEKTVGIRLKSPWKHDDTEFIFWMKRDMLIQELTTGACAALDHKTRWGQINQYWLNKFKCNSQFAGYIWGTQQAVKHIPNSLSAQKIYVNVISMAKLPSSSRKCRIHKTPYSECRELHTDSQLLQYGRTPQQLEAWRLGVSILAPAMQDTLNSYTKIELLPYAPRLGMFRNHGEPCVYCDLKSWCDQGFDLDLKDAYTDPYRWEPWEEEGEREIFDETI